jgi:hypothetical protein
VPPRLDLALWRAGFDEVFDLRRYGGPCGCSECALSARSAALRTGSGPGIGIGPPGGCLPVKGAHGRQRCCGYRTGSWRRALGTPSGRDSRDQPREPTAGPVVTGTPARPRIRRTGQSEANRSPVTSCHERMRMRRPNRADRRLGARLLRTLSTVCNPNSDGTATGQTVCSCGRRSPARRDDGPLARLQQRVPKLAPAPAVHANLTATKSGRRTRSSCPAA